MENNNILIDGYDVNTVSDGLYKGEKITKDLQGYHLGDTILSNETFSKIEKLNTNIKTSAINKNVANLKILAGTFVAPGALTMYSDSVKDDMEKVAVFVRITWNDGQTSELLMQETIFKELTGKKDIFDLALNTSSHIHDIGKNVWDKLIMNKSIPVTESEFTSSSFRTPSVIKIVDRVARSDNQLLNGAVGWCEIVNNIEVLCIYNSYLKLRDLTFVPSIQNNAIYYEHPHIPGQYMMLDSIFKRVQEEQAAELKQVASKLGAKYILIEMSDNSTVKTNREEKASTGGNLFGFIKVGSKSEYSADSLKKVGQSIVIEEHFKEKSEPEMPQLLWFSHDQNIKELIQTRLSKRGDTFEKHSFVIKCSDYSVMNSETAGNIDAVIKKIGVKQNANMKKHVEKERDQVMNFYIEF